jgi:hypothetical protein
MKFFLKTSSATNPIASVVFVSDFRKKGRSLRVARVLEVRWATAECAEFAIDIVSRTAVVFARRVDDFESSMQEAVNSCFTSTNEGVIHGESI